MAKQNGKPLDVDDALNIFGKKKGYASLEAIPLPPQLVGAGTVPSTTDIYGAYRTAAAARFLAHRGGFTQSAQSLMGLLVAAFLAAGLAISTSEQKFNWPILGAAALFLLVYWVLMYLEVKAKRLEQYAALWEQAAESVH